MRKYCSNTKGFTLLELLMAMLLFSVVIVFIFTAFSFQTISLAKNRKIIEDDNLGVKDMEDEIQYIKEYQLGRKPDYDIDAIPTGSVSVFSGTRQRDIEVLEVVKDIGEDGKKINTFISKGSPVDRSAPVIEELKATLKVGGTEVDYAYLDEDFEITLDAKMSSSSQYLNTIYEWYISKPGHGIFVNKNIENLTTYQRFGIPKTLQDYKLMANVLDKHFLQKDLVDSDDAEGWGSGYSRDFKGGFINATAKPRSKHGKIGEEIAIDVPVYIAGLPYSHSVYAHLDASFIEFNNPESFTPEEVDASLKSLGKNFDVDINAMNKSTGAPHITIKDFITSTKSGNYYKYLDFKGDSIYRMLVNYADLRSEGEKFEIYVVARPKDGNLDATIVSSDYSGNRPGWTLDFKGIKGRYIDGTYQLDKFDIKFDEENINADGWNVFAIGYSDGALAEVRVNGGTETKGQFLFSRIMNGLAIGGFENGYNLFEPSSVDIAEVVIYRGSDWSMSWYKKLRIEDYFISKYEIEPSPNMPDAYFSKWR